VSEPDPSLRRRLRALAAREQLPVLSASERVRAELRAQAAQGSRAQGRRWLGPVALAIAAACALAIAGVDSAHHALVPIASQAPDRPGVPSAASSSRDDARCAAFSGRPLAASATGRAALELGTRALFSADRDADVSVSLSPSCDVSVELRAGSLFVHARALEGRTLRVLTPRGSVTVRGTIFVVRAQPASLAVLVDEGSVQVESAQAGAVLLSAGQTAHASSGAWTRQSATLAARNEARARLGLTLHPPPPPPPRARGRDVPQGAQVELDRQPEESIWYPGSVPTPSFAPEPTTSVTDEGRPMHKPRIIQGD
jgi:hypothetical protein